MDSRTQMTMLISNSGLMNNPNACIKSLNSTLVCMCDKCLKEHISETAKFFKSLKVNKIQKYELRHYN